MASRAEAVQLVEGVALVGEVHAAERLGAADHVEPVAKLLRQRVGEVGRDLRRKLREDTPQRLDRERAELLVDGHDPAGVHAGCGHGRSRRPSGGLLHGGAVARLALGQSGLAVLAPGFAHAPGLPGLGLDHLVLRRAHGQEPRAERVLLHEPVEHGAAAARENVLQEALVEEDGLQPPGAVVEPDLVDREAAGAA